MFSYYFISKGNLLVISHILFFSKEKRNHHFVKLCKKVNKKYSLFLMNFKLEIIIFFTFHFLNSFYNILNKEY